MTKNSLNNFPNQSIAISAVIIAIAIIGLFFFIKNSNHLKTYSSEKYGYSVEYPKSMRPGFSSEDRTIFMGRRNDQILAGITVLSQNKTNESLMGMTYNGDMAQFATELERNHPDGCQSVESVTVAGRDGIHQECIGAFAGETIQYYLVANRDNLFVIDFYGDSDDQNKLVDTFRFN